jgi:hypothetical protein
MQAKVNEEKIISQYGKITKATKTDFFTEGNEGEPS